jgi:hypothetical protein
VLPDVDSLDSELRKMLEERLWGGKYA